MALRAALHVGLSRMSTTSAAEAGGRPAAGVSYFSLPSADGVAHRRQRRETEHIHTHTHKHRQLLLSRVVRMTSLSAKLIFNRCAALFLSSIVV